MDTSPLPAFLGKDLFSLWIEKEIYERGSTVRIRTRDPPMQESLNTKGEHANHLFFNVDAVQT